jgi:predicted  nucleic acid-binding Zn-ribbon protein
MGQTVKLRRSAVAGKKPINSQLELGELSVNTTDGKLFFAKSGSVGPSVQEIITTDTVNTGSIEVSGSLSVTGSITGTQFTGSGLGLTEVPLALSGSDAADVSIDGTFTRIKFDESTGIKISGTTGGDATVFLSGVASDSNTTEGRTAKLTVTGATSTWTLTHNLNERHPVVEVFDSNDEIIIPQKIEATSDNQIVVTFSTPQTGTVTATVGGGLPTIESGYGGRILSVGTDGVATWKTGVLSGSVDLTTLTTTSSFNTYTSSTDDRLDSIETTSGSHSDRLDSLETTSGSQNNRIGSLETISSSHDGRLDSLETKTGSLDSDISTLDGRVDSLETKTGSLDGDISTLDGRVDSLETESGSIRSDFNSYTSSNDSTNTTQNSRISSLETTSGSNISRLGSLETESGSIRGDFNTYTSSNDSTNTSQNNRLNSLETNSGSQATDIGTLQSFQDDVEAGLQFTGSNVTVKGNLLVKGTETKVNSTTVDIGDNIVSLNGTGATNAGIEVRDTESPGVLSGSLIYDTGDNTWKAGIKGSEERILINSDLTTLDGRLDSLETTSGSHGDRIDSIETSTSSLNSFTSSINTTIKNKLNTDGVISGSEQVDHDATTNYSANEHIDHSTITIGSGKGLSGGGTIVTNRSLELNTGSNHFLDGVKSKLNSETVVSGSEQIDITSTTNYNLVDGRLDSIETFTGSIDNTYATDTDVTNLRNTLNTYTSSNDSTNTTQNSRISSLETTSGSHDGRLDSLETKTGSLETTNTTQNSRLSSLETKTGSLDSKNNTQDNRLDSLETKTGSLDSDISTLTNTDEGMREDFNTYTSSNNSVNTTQDNRLNSLETKTGSLDSDISTLDSRVDSLEIKTGSLDSDITTLDGRLDSLETESGSIRTDFNSHTSSINGRVDSVENKIDSLQTESGSIRSDFNSYTSSNDSTNTTQNNKISSLETTSGSHNSRLTNLETFETKVDNGLEFTGSNVTIKGNLLVKGTETRVNSTTVDINDNIISLNGSGAASAGIEVQDVTSPGTLSGSLIWDGSNNYWKAGTKTNEEKILVQSDYTTLDGRLDSLETTSGSHEGRLDSIESQTGSYLTSYNNEYTTGATFNTSNGLITFTRNDGDTFTVDIDGKYAESGHNHDDRYYTETETGNFFDGTTSISGYNKTNWDNAYGWGDHSTVGYITGFTDTNIHTTGATFGTSDGIITFTNNQGDTYTVDIDGRFSLSNHNHDDRYYLETEIDNFFDGTTSISGYNKTNWDNAYGWGDHSTAGYLTSYNNEYTTGATFNTGNGIITFTRNDGDTFSVDLDGKYFEISGGTLSGNITIQQSNPTITLDETDVTARWRLRTSGGSTRFQYASDASTYSDFLTLGATSNTIENNTTFNGTVTASSLIKSGGTSSQFLKADGSVDSNTYLTSHPNISAASSSNNSGRTYIQDLLLDGNGHVTGITTATETVTNTDTNYFTTGATFNTSNGIITFTDNQGDTYTVDIDGRFLTSYTETDPVFTAHAAYGITSTKISNWDTAYGWGDHSTAGYLTSHPSISAASSSNNGGRTYIQDILLDGNGHVTGITTATETVTNTDTNYYVDGLSFDTATGVLTASVNGATNQTVDLDGRYSLSSHNHDSDYVNVSGDTMTGKLTVNSGGALIQNSGSSQSTVLTIEQTADVGSTSDLLIKTAYDRDVGIRLETLGGSHNIWQDSNGDDALIISAGGYNRTNDATAVFKQDHSVQLPNGSLTATSIIKSGGTSSQFLKADGSVDSNTYLTSHPSISAASSSNNSGRTYIQDILVDGNGHVTGITTATETVTNTDEYTTGVTWNGTTAVLTFTRNDGDTYSVTMLETLSDVTVTGGTYTSGTQTLTLTKSDGNTVSVTGFAVDTDVNWYTTGATFNTGNGVITGTHQGGTWTVDIDGRYSLTSHNHDSDYLALSGGTLTGGLNGTTGTFSGKGTFDNLELTSGARHLTITQSSDDWFIYNDQQDNGIVIYNGTGGVEIHYSGSSIADFDSTGITLRDNVTMAGSSTIDMGTNTITDTKVGQWDTAYGWGDHSQEGYLTTYNDEYTTGATFSTSTGVITFTRNDGDTFTVDIDGRFLTSYTETDTLANVTSRGATTTDNITTGHHTIKSGNTNKQSRHLLYIGGDGLASADASIYLGNDGNGGGYGWELFYEGSGSGNANAFILRAENLGTSVDTMKVLQDGTVTFVNNITTSGTITASGGNSGNWNTAYGWGDHSTAGYLTSFSESDTLDSVVSRGSSTSSTVSVGRLNIGSTADSDFLTGNSELSANGYIMTKAIVNTSETGTGPAAIVFGNGSTYGSDQISFVTVGNTRMYIDNNGVDVSVQLNMSADIDMGTNTITDTKVGQWDTAYGWGDHSTAGYISSYVNDIDYIDSATFNTGTGVITGTGVGNAGFTVDIDGRYLLDSTDTFTGALTINGDIRGNGQQLVLNAGESYSYATGQTNEYVYVNAEQGLEVNSETGNWSGGWAARKTALLRGDLLRIDGEDLTKTNIQNFKTAYGWGNHASGGYLTSSSQLNASNMTTGTLPDVMSNTTRYNIGYIDGVSQDSRDKIRVWESASYTIGMKSGYDYGHLGSGEYAMSFQMNDNPGRGWWWGHDSHTDDQGAMALTTDGELVLAKSLSIGQGESVTAPSDTPLYVEGTTSGSTVFDVQGTQGQLFSITDDLTGDLFEVSDISGIPILTVNASGTVTVDETLHVTGDVIAYYSSDEKLKDNVKPIENPLDKIKMIGGYEFDWNGLSKNEGHDVGVIAQEIEKVLPEVVTTRSNGYKAVKYEKLTALLIQANKELLEKVEKLEKKINDK